MTRHPDRSWTVLTSVENDAHDRCVDLFRRSDGTWGFEEFRRDVEDGGAWTPGAAYSLSSYPSRETAWERALRTVAWLAEA